MLLAFIKIQEIKSYKHSEVLRLEKGKQIMETVLLSIAQLVLVAAVYFFAYKNGYKTAQAKAASIVQEVSDPVNNLLDRLNKTVAELIPHEPSGLGN
jgi:hypothetical protein